MNKSTIPNIIIVLLGLFTTLVCYADLRVYTGSIAKQPVIVELAFDAKNQLQGGRYAYVKQGKLLLLQTTKTDNTLEEFTTQYDHDLNNTRPSWQIKATGNTLNGEWRSANGNKFPIQLQLMPDNARNSRAQLDNALDGAQFNLQLAQQSAALQFKTRSATQANLPVTVLNWERADFEVIGVQLAKPSQAGDILINQQLKIAAQNHIGIALDCATFTQTFPSFALRSKISSANTHYVTLETNTESNCGGPHPTTRNDYQSYRRDTGQRIDINASYEFDGANTTAFRQWIAKEYGHDDECTSRKNILAGGVFLRASAITEQGVLISLEFGQRMSECNTEFTLPYATLRRFKRAKAPLDLEKFK